MSRCGSFGCTAIGQGKKSSAIRRRLQRHEQAEAEVAAVPHEQWAADRARKIDTSMDEGRASSSRSHALNALPDRRGAEPISFVSLSLMD